MAQFHPAWLEHQRKRWRRHDWHRYVRPDSEGAGVGRTSRPQPADVEQDSIARKDSAVETEAASEELEAERSKLLELKALAAELQWQLALRRFGRKYRPDQARDERGRWVDEGGPADTRNENDAIDLSDARRRNSLREARCLAQYALDTIVCTRARSRACHEQAALRYSNCLVGRPIPPLNY
jgi:hypothetical protein